MTVKFYLAVNETIVTPFTSVASIEDVLIEEKYVVVKNDDEFVGILTPADVIRSGHQLVIDCITPKTPVYENEDVEQVIEKMCAEKQYVLPVLDDSSKYIGSVTYLHIIEELISLERLPVNISVKNIISDKPTEDGKEQFLKELRHHTKNPIQVIYSSLSIMKTTMSDKERWLLLKSIENCTQQIDMIINKLCNEYSTVEGIKGKKWTP